MLHKTKSFLSKNKGNIILSATILVLSVDASAYSSPTSGAAGYDFWDIAINDILKGPIGSTVGVLAMAAGTMFMMSTKYVPALSAIGGGALLYNTDDIATSFGISVLQLV